MSHSTLLTVMAAIAVTCSLSAQRGSEPAAQGRGEARATRPPLFFREEWKQVPGGGEHPVTPGAVANPNLELKLYGPDASQIQLTGAAKDEANPIHMWTGLCTMPCAATLRDRANLVDLSGLGRIRWVTKVSGLHQVRPIVKLADGTWLVGSHADGSTLDWHVGEFSLAENRWLRLDIDKVVTKGNWIDKADLSKVDEVGFADLLPGSGHGPGGWSDVASIEVFGLPVKR